MTKTQEVGIRDLLAFPFSFVGFIFLYAAICVGGTFTAIQLNKLLRLDYQDNKSKHN